MADLTIHELQNEATTPAANDYMVLDGATAGTRKIDANKVSYKSELNNRLVTVSLDDKTVAQVNALTGMKNGDSYIVTDSGTLTDGSLAVGAGDQVAWDATNSVWYKLSAFATWVHNLWAAFVHACTAITSFANGDTFSVSNPTDGTRKMSKDTLLTLTSQNALAGNVALEFVPNFTTTVVGLPYMYNGSMYMAKEAYQGPWDATKFYTKSFADFISFLVTEQSAKNVQIRSLTESLSKEPIEYSLGGFDASGNEIFDLTRVRTNFIDATKILGLTIDIPVGYEYILIAYDENKDFVAKDTAWKSSVGVASAIFNQYHNSAQPNFYHEAHYYRLAFRKNLSPELTEDDVAVITSSIKVDYELDDCKDLEYLQKCSENLLKINKVPSKYLYKFKFDAITRDYNITFNVESGKTYRFGIYSDDVVCSKQDASVTGSFVKLSTGASGSLIDEIFKCTRGERLFFSAIGSFTASADASSLNLYLGNVYESVFSKAASTNIYFYVIEESVFNSLNTFGEVAIENDVRIIKENLGKIDLAFEVGGIDEYGVDTETPSRLRTGFVDLSEITAVKFNLKNGLHVYVYAYDENKNYLGRGSAWYNDGMMVSNEAKCNNVANDAALVGAKYFRFLFGYFSSGNSDSALFSGVDLTDIDVQFIYEDDLCMDLKKFDLQNAFKSSGEGLCQQYPYKVFCANIGLNAEYDLNFYTNIVSGHKYMVALFFESPIYFSYKNYIESSAIKFSTGSTGNLGDIVYQKSKLERNFLALFAEFTATSNKNAVNVFVRDIKKMGNARLTQNMTLCVVDLDVDTPMASQVTGIGNGKYIGEKITIDENVFSAKYLWTLANAVESTHPMQAIAVHNNVLFVGYDGGHCITHDIRTGKKLHQFDFDGAAVASNHCGNLNFGTKYFADNEDFPALYISGDLTNLCCYVESVHSNTSSIKQKIVFNLDTYKKANGSQVVIDSKRNKIIYMQRVINSISDLSNKLFCAEFDLPALTDGVLTDGVLIVTLDDSDVTDSYELSDYKGIYQGAIASGGKLYQLHGDQDDGEGHFDGVMVFDIETHQMVSYVDLTPFVLSEPQGICIDGGSVYVNFLTSPARLYKLNF